MRVRLTGAGVGTAVWVWDVLTLRFVRGLNRLPNSEVDPATAAAGAEPVAAGGAGGGGGGGVDARMDGLALALTLEELQER